ncbi:amidohydrolase family protein, partial [Streptomyces sp. SID3343]|uniref:amidohydrolase n=1 Tax=Streptomyces sp. SID3343 TaxID=2690260 RepID=UPI0031F877AC
VTGPGSAADLIFVRGTVCTLDPGRPFAEAAAVAAGRIAAVGAEREVRSLVGPRTETVDLAGGMLLPGFQDAHIHPGLGGLHLMRCNLGDLHSRRDYVSAVGAYARTHPEVPWILGGGWSMDAFPGGVPHRADLDTVVRDRPVYLPNRDSHSAWVNSVALEMAGVDAHTPDPVDGRIERDRDGVPTGALHEGAMRLVGALVPRPTQDDVERALLAAQSHLHALGITAWQDAMVVNGLNAPDSLDAYRALAERGELTARVAGALGWDRRRGGEQLDDLVELCRTGSGGRFRSGTVKIMQDGVLETCTAALLD